MQFDMRVTAGGLNEVLDKALQVAPGLSDSTFTEARVGYRPFTPGFLPIIGEVPEGTRAYSSKWIRCFRINSWTFPWAATANLAIGEQSKLI